MITATADFFKKNFALHGWAIVVLAGFCYLGQGGRGYIDQSLTWITVYGLDSDLALVENAKTIGKLPWSFKFLIGLISDNLPIMGYNVKPYMFLMALIGFVSVTMMGLSAFTPTLGTLTIAYIGVQFYGASADCLTDALVVKNGRNDEEDSTSGLQSISWFSLGIGGAFFNVIGGYMSTDHSDPPANEDSVSLEGTRLYNILMTVFPIGLFVLMFFVKEEKSKIRPGLKALGQQLVRLGVALFSPPFLVLRVLIWIVICQGSKISLTTPYSVFLTSELHIKPDVQSWIDASLYLFLSAGVVIYYKFFRHTSFRRIYFASQILYAFAVAMDYALVRRWNVSLGIPDVAFLVFSGAFSEVIDRLNSMPFLVMAGQLCPDNMEATFFSALMSISNQGQTLAGFAGVYVQKQLGITKKDISQYENAILIKSALCIGICALLFLLPDTNALNATKAESIKPTNPTLKAIFKWAELDGEDKSSETEEKSKDLEAKAIA